MVVPLLKTFATVVVAAAAAVMAAVLLVVLVDVVNCCLNFETELQFADVVAPIESFSFLVLVSNIKKKFSVYIKLNSLEMFGVYDVRSSLFNKNLKT